MRSRLKNWPPNEPELVGSNCNLKQLKAVWLGSIVLTTVMDSKRVKVETVMVVAAEAVSVAAGSVVLTSSDIVVVLRTPKTMTVFV